MICRHPVAGLSTSTPVTEGETHIGTNKIFIHS